MKNSFSFGRGVTKQAVAGLGVALCVSTSSFAFAGGEVTETRDVQAFHGIRVDGGVELRVKVGKDQKLDITADDEDIEKVETIVEDGVLIIDTKEDEDRSWYESKRAIEVEISLPELKYLDIRGAVDGEIDDVDSENITIDIRGAAGIELDGKCGELELEIRGAAAVDAEGLKCESVNVSLRGTGYASVHASEKVDADLRGVGAINIEGEPKTVKKAVRGIGVIND
ncbi:MAG: head GIN domain-containing protein [Kordiimonas sp.]